LLVDLDGIDGVDTWPWCICWSLGKSALVGALVGDFVGALKGYLSLGRMSDSKGNISLGLCLTCKMLLSSIAIKNTGKLEFALLLLLRFAAEARLG
jgi:hypothetical protein